MSWRDKNWVATTSVLLKIGLVLAGLYLAAVYLERHWREPLRREEPKRVERHPDVYVYPPRSHVSSVETARSKLVGETLWVKEGWRWEYEPAGKLFGPLEQVKPTRVLERDGETYIEFERDGSPQRFPITIGGRFWVDDLFFIEDPVKTFEHWTEADWDHIRAQEAFVGMSEFQAAFALGAGQLVRSSPGGATRVIDYRAREAVGLEPLRVTFKDGEAAEIEPLDAE